METFIGHLHPLLVHLPIGILLLATLFAWLGQRSAFQALLPAIPIILRLGAAAALAACLSGWLLGNSGDYSLDRLQWHQWLGIATAACALLACYWPQQRVIITLMAILLIATGHFGAALTHGENYLTSAFQTTNSPKIRPENLQEAPVFAGIISPIFQEKCWNCHGSTRQKGGLRLDGPAQLQAGGKSGNVLNFDSPEGTELLRRCLLPLGHEDHMPPKGKAQLSTDELEILRWWIAAGADFQKKAGEIPQTAMLQAALVRWQQAAVPAPDEAPVVPKENPPAADEQVVALLRQSGLQLVPLSREQHWLSVSFVNASQPRDTLFDLLEKLAPQVLWLNLNDCQIPATAWQAIGKLRQLRRLSLANASVNDAALQELSKLDQLQYLNLMNTPVTEKGIQQLVDLEKLEQLFLYRCNLSTEALEGLRRLFPKAIIDTGSYQLPMLDSDTARLKVGKSYE